MKLNLFLYSTTSNYSKTTIYFASPKYKWNYLIIFKAKELVLFIGKVYIQIKNFQRDEF